MTSKRSYEFNSGEELSYLLGALRDASIHRYGSDYEIIILQKDKSWLDMISKFIMDLFDIKTKISLGDNCYRIRFRSKSLFNKLVSEFDFPENGKQTEWSTPQKIRENILSRKMYISGFFDAEGGVSVTNHRRLYPRIDFYQSWNNKSGCPPLEDIKEFLEDFGIKCGKIRERKATKISNYPRYVLSISSLNGVNKFCNLINSLHPTKRMKLKRLLSLT